MEIVTTLKADRAIVDKVAAYARDTLGEDHRIQDQAGFIVNALLILYLTHAIRMFETGFASAEDIDEGMVSGCGHPMGPLRLCDTVGLDICLAVAESLRRIRRSALRTAGAAAPHGRRRLPRPQDRARVPRVPIPTVVE